LGNCLYDKDYTQEIVKLKVQPSKFDQADLHRRPEFQQQQQPPDIKPPLMFKSHPRLGSDVSTTITNKPPIPTGLNTPITPIIQKPTTTTTTTTAPSAKPLPTRPSLPAQYPSKQKPITTPNHSIINDTEDDSFNCNSQDDAFFAGIDWEDLGRPIDFEESTADASTVTAGEAPLTEEDLKSDQPEKSHQVHQPTSRINQATFPPRTNPHQNTTTKRPATPSMGGFHFPPGMVVRDPQFYFYLSFLIFQSLLEPTWTPTTTAE
jgi:hypothetical protein